ncbi:unnamed protein product [Phytophthora fragariaefolia]|uniref:Unnamed protein product n=1 Tax=Phytophthora fragariaefolia TaxID=1490495 RepID=A0A9W6Y8W2_9STRA|nr:unnamed protein product [Phytophthora fragariaefolia]
MPVASISVEIEALRNDWRAAMKLISLVDYAFISKDYLREKLGFQTARQFFEAILANQWVCEDLAEHAKAFVCPWGSEGVYYLDMAGSTMHHVSTIRLDNVVETIGAGDAFIGASLAGLSRWNLPLAQVLKTACEVASAKCLKPGFALAPEDKQVWEQRLQRELGTTNAYAA